MPPLLPSSCRASSLSGLLRHRLSLLSIIRFLPPPSLIDSLLTAIGPPPDPANSSLIHGVAPLSELLPLPSLVCSFSSCRASCPTGSVRYGRLTLYLSEDSVLSLDAMAVTSDFLLDEDSGNESPSEGCPGLRNPSSADQVEERQDHMDEPLEPCVALSEEALVLLRRASRSLVKRRRTTRSVVAPLYRQLKSLRNLVPYSTPAKESCVITDALGYLKRLKQEIEDLHDGLETEDPIARTPKDAFPSTVNITSVDQRLLVHVSCQKRPGLMAELMVVLEESGLVFDDVNASCNSCLTFDASSSQKGMEAVDKKALRDALLKTIYEQQ